MYEAHPQYLEAKKERIANGEEEDEDLDDSRRRRELDRKEKPRERR
jgi:hypothetical protein